MSEQQKQSIFQANNQESDTKRDFREQIKEANEFNKENNVKLTGSLVSALQEAVDIYTANPNLFTENYFHHAPQNAFSENAYDGINKLILVSYMTKNNCRNGNFMTSKQASESKVPVTDKYMLYQLNKNKINVNQLEHKEVQMPDGKYAQVISGYTDDKNEYHSIPFEQATKGLYLTKGSKNNTVQIYAKSNRTYVNGEVVEADIARINNYSVINMQRFDHFKNMVIDPVTPTEKEKATMTEQMQVLQEQINSYRGEMSTRSEDLLKIASDTTHQIYEQMTTTQEAQTAGNEQTLTENENQVIEETTKRSNGMHL